MEKEIFIVRLKKGKAKMYKEIIVCIIVIALIFSIDLISNNYTKKVFKEMNEILGNLRNEMIKEEDNAKINEGIKRLEKKWNENFKTLSFYIEHNELEEVAKQITLIKGNADIKEYSQAIPQLDECVFLLNHIKDQESLLIRNLF